MKNQNFNAVLKENKNREKLLEKNINHRPVRAVITDRRRNDINVFRKLISCQVSADDLQKKVMDVFNQLGIYSAKDQIYDPHRMIGSMNEGNRDQLNVQTVCVPVNDTASLLIFASARPENMERFHLRYNAPLEIDHEIEQFFDRFLSVLNNALYTESVLNSMQSAVLSDVETLAIRTLQGLPCTVFLTSDMAVFTDPATGRAFCVFKDRASTEIVFQTAENSFLKITTEANIALVSGVRFDFTGNKGKLLDWLPPVSDQAMKKSIRGWGGSLILWGAISMLFPNVFDSRWGIGLLVLGVINLVITHRSLFIINGLAMMTVGIWNFVETIAAGNTNVFWAVAGFFQIGWGVKEILEFSKYRNVKKEKAEEKNE
jgi:hypothetical protein